MPWRHSGVSVHERIGHLGEQTWRRSLDNTGNTLKESRLPADLPPRPLVPGRTDAALVLAERCNGDGGFRGASVPRFDTVLLVSRGRTESAGGLRRLGPVVEAPFRVEGSPEPGSVALIGGGCWRWGCCGVGGWDANLL